MRAVNPDILRPVDYQTFPDSSQVVVWQVKGRCGATVERYADGRLIERIVSPDLNPYGVFNAVDPRAQSASVQAVSDGREVVYEVG